MSEPYDLRPPGSTHDVWIVERRMPSSDLWFVQEVWFHNVTANYDGMPDIRIRTGTLTINQENTHE